MTKQEAKGFLSRVKDLVRTEKRIIGQINRLKDKQLSLEINLTGMPKGSLAYSMADYVADLDELQRKLAKAIEEERGAYKEILEVLNALEGIYKDITIMHYLMLMSWEEIAVQVSLTYRWVQTLHSRALDEVVEILERKHVKAQ